MMKLVFVYCLAVLLFLILSSCDTNEPLPQGAIGLTLEDVSCTEAWITLTVGNLAGTAYIKITNNGNLIETIDVNATKTLLYYDTLQPNTNYEFQAFSSQRGEDIIGNKLQVTTLDTTSHNFTWQTFEFGQHSSSVLYDVAIINENNIWAVGEIYMNDSLGNPDPTFYNAAHWNGQNWELKKLFYKGGIWIIKTVFAFNENDIWFTGYIRYLNGQFIELTIPSILQGWGKNKMWGSNSKDLYIVGNNGNIAHYNGGNWTKIESGTTTDIQDILGYNDNFTNESDVYCAVSYVFQSGDRKILRIKNNKVDSLSWFGDKRINSVWTPNNSVFYSAGDGVFENKNNSWNQIIGLPPYYSNNIRGNGLNDIYVCGDFGLLSHFNGSTWQTYNEHYMQGILFSVATKQNTAITVGFNGSKAIIIKGTRN
jgi:hypothetical protein